VDASVLIALMAVCMAAINTAGSVLMLWIRASYKWRETSSGAPNGNGQAPPDPTRSIPPAGPPTS
jgi:hypothetical protein